MHDQPKVVTTLEEDLASEGAVFAHVMDAYPTTLRISDVIREVGDNDRFPERDSVERAIREMIRVGLLFRCENCVLPTRGAIRVWEVMQSQ
jgi:hypothetical protein